MDQIRENENDFSFWFPKVENCGISVPKTFFKKLPSVEEEPGIYRLYEAFYMESPKEDMQVISEWLDRDVIPELMERRLYGHLFVKNGRFSNKFLANGSCSVYGTHGLASAIANINYQAMCCGAGGVDEIVVREFIECDLSKIPCIYNGLPLRSEFRVFYDFDACEVIFVANYWDFDYVYPNLYSMTDKIVFEWSIERMDHGFNRYKDFVCDIVRAAMKNVEGLSGKWSVDILLDEKGEAWLIDMATAESSAYWEMRPDKEKCQ